MVNVHIPCMDPMGNDQFGKLEWQPFWQKLYDHLMRKMMGFKSVHYGSLMAKTPAAEVPRLTSHDTLFPNHRPTKPTTPRR